MWWVCMLCGYVWVSHPGKIMEFLFRRLERGGNPKGNLKKREGLVGWQGEASTGTKILCLLLWWFTLAVKNWCTVAHACCSIHMTIQDILCILYYTWCTRRGWCLNSLWFWMDSFSIHCNVALIWCRPEECWAVPQPNPSHDNKGMSIVENNHLFATLFFAAR